MSAKEQTSERNTGHKKKRGYHHGDTRTAAMTVVRRLLGRRNPKDFSLTEVAAKIGVSHAALYRHFEGKRGMLAAVAVEGHHAFGERLAVATGEASGKRAIEGQLEAATHCYFTFVSEEVGYFRAMFHPSLRVKTRLPALEKAAAANYQTLGAIVTSLPTTVAATPEEVGAIVWAALHGLATLHADGWLAGRQGLSSADLERRLPTLMSSVLLGGLCR